MKEEINEKTAELKRMQATEVLMPKLERRRSRTWTKIKTGL